MPVTGLHHYNLRASRPTLDALRDFYVNVVGLQPGYRPPFASFGYWLYAGEQAVLHLSEAAPQELRRPNALNTFDHVAFASTDFTLFEARLRELNISYTSDQVPSGGQRQIFFSDPAGNGVELNFAADDA
ncbi:MAG: VOC family protein [Pseudomonadota bacterium]